MEEKTQRRGGILGGGGGSGRSREEGEEAEQRHGATNDPHAHSQKDGGKSLWLKSGAPGW